MKLNSVNNVNSASAPSEAGALQRGQAASVDTASGAPAAALQSELLQPALAALRAMPDFDHERVAQLRDALAKGELPFDPARLAGLIQRFHGGKA